MNKNNLSSILLAVLLSTAAFGFIQNIYSQEEILMDSIITGNRYRITMYNDNEVIGKVVKQDSVYIYMVSETGTSRIRFEDIFSVSKSTVPRLLKALFTLGGGVLLESGYDNYGDNNKAGYSIQLTGLFPFSENKAMRLDLSFGQFKRDRMMYSYYYDPNPSTYTYQDINLYSAYVDFIFGDFNTRSDFSVYGLAGLGITHVSEGNYDYRDYNYNDTTYFIRTVEGNNYTNFSMTIGGGLRIKISNRIGVFTEAQYNLTTYGGYFFFFGRGYFPIRAGITYSIY